jgi:hypothetical protein
MAVCAAPLGVVLGGLQPMMLTHEMTPAPRHGQALAMRLLMMNVSSVSMPLVSGLAGGLIGASGVFWAMGALMGSGPFLSTRLRPRAQAGDGAG